jgi:hypothetical protein
MAKVIEFYTEESKMNPGIKILVAVTEDGDTYVVGGDTNFCTKLVEYGRCFQTKTMKEWKEANK